MIRPFHRQLLALAALAGALSACGAPSAETGGPAPAPAEAAASTAGGPSLDGQSTEEICGRIPIPVMERLTGVTAGPLRAYYEGSVTSCDVPASGSSEVAWVKIVDLEYSSIDEQREVRNVRDRREDLPELGQGAFLAPLGSGTMLSGYMVVAELPNGQVVQTALTDPERAKVPTRAAVIEWHRAVADALS